jgi:hypothetical protein
MYGLNIWTLNAPPDSEYRLRDVVSLGERSKRRSLHVVESELQLSSLLITQSKFILNVKI